MSFFRANSGEDRDFATLGASYRRSGYFAPAVLLLLSTIVAGCVGSTHSSLNLSSNTQPTAEAPVLALQDGFSSTTENTDLSSTTQPTQQSALNQTTSGGVAIPVRSPQSPAPTQEVAKAEVLTSELAVVEQTNNTSSTSTVIESKLVQSAPKIEGTSEAASADPLAPKPVEVSSIANPEAAPKPAKPKSSNNFFQRLFPSKDKKQETKIKPKRIITQQRESRGDGAVRVASAHQTAKTKKVKKSARRSILLSRTRAARANSNGVLPGVKSKDALFGITNSNSSGASENTRLAAVGSFGRLSPNGLRVQHSKVQVQCLKPRVLQLLKLIERRYGSKPIITSGYRSPKGNRRAGGASKSQHIYCKAVDIQIEGVSKWELAKYVRSIPGRGGVGTYCRTKSVHIDIGSKRDWHHPCRRSKTRKRKKA